MEDKYRQKILSPIQVRGKFRQTPVFNCDSLSIFLNSEPAKIKVHLKESFVSSV